MRPEHPERLLVAGKKVKCISVQLARDTTLVNQLIYLKVLRSSATTVTTVAIPSLGLKGRTLKQRLANEIVWNRNSLRQIPFEEENEFYRIYQEMNFVVVGSI